MPAAIYQLSDREVLGVFGQNLRDLTANVPSISALCQELQINRAQFNRYLTGEAMPRSLTLRRICRHFNVDARILIEPLDDLRGYYDNPLLNLFKTIGHVLTPVSRQVLPDGLYVEWRMVYKTQGFVHFDIFRIYTEDGIRRTKYYARDPIEPVVPGLKNLPTRVKFSGVALSQRNGFCIVDMPEHGDTLTIASYRYGMSHVNEVYYGIKLAGSNYSQTRSHSCSPCMLEPLPAEFRATMRRRRAPRVVAAKDAPRHVMNVLREIAESGFSLPMPAR